MVDLRISQLPDLELTVLVGAFAGWNDAGSAATWAVKFLVNHWDAVEFGDLEPDSFYEFTEARPQVRISGGAIRQFSWPSTRFYYHRAERDETGHQLGRDVVLLIGEEPQLRWRAFGRAVGELCQRCHVEDVVLLGALAAEVPHTAPVKVSGVATRGAALRHLTRAEVEPANYEGPTGIVGALQEMSRRAGLTTTSLWGVAPHYVAATPNLPVAEALLRKLDQIEGFDLRLHDLSRAARRFNQRVSSLVAEDAEVSAYVRELERRTSAPTGARDEVDADERAPSSRAATTGELPSPEEAVRDVEAWLRDFRKRMGAE